jgi:flagellar biosynthesis GTPase FlhF
MKTIRITSTCAFALLLAVAAPGWAQEQHEQEQKAAPAKQEEKQAKPEKSAKPEKQQAVKQQKAAKPEKQQAVKQQKAAKPEKQQAVKQEKPAKPEEKSAQPSKESKGEMKNDMRPGGQVQPGKDGGHAGGGRIPADRYKAKFGAQHTFHVSQNDYTRNHRFEYGGYSFGFVGTWPSDWLYTQDVYVIEIDGVYYLCNPMFPGVNLEINVIM